MEERNMPRRPRREKADDVLFAPDVTVTTDADIFSAPSI